MIHFGNHTGPPDSVFESARNIARLEKKLEDREKWVNRAIFITTIALIAISCANPALVGIIVGVALIDLTLLVLRSKNNSDQNAALNMAYLDIDETFKRVNVRRPEGRPVN